MEVEAEVMWQITWSWYYIYHIIMILHYPQILKVKDENSNLVWIFKINDYISSILILVTGAISVV